MPRGDADVPDADISRLITTTAVSTIFDGLGREIIAVDDAPDGVTRDQLTVPICRTPMLADDVLYDAPAGGATYYVPRWRIVQPPDGLPQISITQAAGSWVLTVHLEAYAAPSIADQLGEASPLPCDLACLFRYNLAASAGASDGSILRELQATEVTGDGTHLVASFTGTDPAALNQIYSAMTNDAHGPVLVLRRTATAAVELPEQEPSLGGTRWPIFTAPIIRNPPEPIFVVPDDLEVRTVGVEDLSLVKVQPVEVGDLSLVKVLPVDVTATLTPGLFRGGILRMGAMASRSDAPAAAPAGGGAADHPVLGVSGLVQHPMADDEIRLVDDLRRQRRRWLIPLPEDVPRFGVTTSDLDDSQAFFYPPQLYPSIYAGVTVGAASFAMRRVEVLYDGVPYPYYQEVANAANFYYLPDSFKLGRSISAPHMLMLRVGAADTDGTMEHVKVSFSFIAVPYISADRLAQAVEALRPRAPGPYPPGVAGPQLMPLVVAQSALRLSMLLAGAASHAGEGAILSLRNGIKSSDDLSVADFATVYNALFGGVALMSGSLELDLASSGGTTESVPVELRVGDPWGPVLDSAQQPEPDGSVRVVLTNMVESPVTISALEATVSRVGATPAVIGAASVTALDRSLPMTLAAGEQITLHVSAPDAPGTGPLRATIMPQLTVAPDPRAVWLSVFDHSAPMPLQREVMVRVPIDIFDPRAGAKGHPALKGVTVEFEAGVAATFDRSDIIAGALSPFIVKIVSVPVGLEGYVIAGVAKGTYEYRVAAITDTDALVREAALRVSNLDVLDVTLPAFPPSNP